MPQVGAVFVELFFCPASQSFDFANLVFLPCVYDVHIFVKQFEQDKICKMACYDELIFVVFLA